MILKILDHDKNCNDNWSVSLAVLSASCHHGVTYTSSVCIGGGGHKIRRIAGNILNKQ